MLDEPTNGLDPAGRDEMLDLIRRIGHEFGISILMSSHLLGEIERACDNLVVIDAGRLLRADTIASFTSSMQVLTVEVDAREDDLADRLVGRGLTVGRDGHLLLVGMDGDAPYDFLRDTVVDMGVGLIRLEQRRHRLEDLFRTEAAEDDEPALAGSLKSRGQPTLESPSPSPGEGLG
jgi:ABC-2 type transport system ATP-binding protein